MYTLSYNVLYQYYINVINYVYRRLKVAICWSFANKFVQTISFWCIAWTYLFPFPLLVLVVPKYILAQIT